MEMWTLFAAVLLAWLVRRIVFEWSTSAKRRVVHAPYFAELEKNLKDLGRVGAVPGVGTCLVDMDALDANIEAVKALAPSSCSVRLSSKSIPSFDLLAYIKDAVGTDKLMVFQPSFLLALLRHPEFGTSCDYLLGVTFPASFLRAFVQEAPLFHFAPRVKEAAGRMDLPEQTQQLVREAVSCVQWLVDTPQRLEEYLAVGSELKVDTLRISVELDCGLHRGGCTNEEHLAAMLRLMHSSTATAAATASATRGRSKQGVQLVLSGFMGYDGHYLLSHALWANLPFGLGNRMLTSSHLRTRLAYASFIEFAERKFPELRCSSLCLNSGGTSTFWRFGEESSCPVNDVCVGNAFLKAKRYDPLAADIPSSVLVLASPVLKVPPPRYALLSFLGALWPLLARIYPPWACTYYVQGVPAHSAPLSPSGASFNPVYGGPHGGHIMPTYTVMHTRRTAGRSPLTVGDFFFLRPFEGDAIALYPKLFKVRKGKVTPETVDTYTGGI